MFIDSLIIPTLLSVNEEASRPNNGADSVLLVSLGMNLMLDLNTWKMADMRKLQRNGSEH